MNFGCVPYLGLGIRGFIIIGFCARIFSKIEILIHPCHNSASLARSLLNHEHPRSNLGYCRSIGIYISRIPHPHLRAIFLDLKVRLRLLPATF